LFPRSVTGWTVAVFGALAFALGALGLVSPDTLLGLLGFEVPAAREPGDYTPVFVAASSMASFNMGVYYLVAAATEWRPFFRATVVFRLVTVTAFTALVVTGAAPERFLGVAAWEGFGALATGAALLVDARAHRSVLAVS
jgi:hypothetical protein